MNDRNTTHFSSEKNEKEYLTSKPHGPQGVDKVAGEETSGDNQNVVAKTQKGKNKVDGDPSQKSDQPIENK